MLRTGGFGDGPVMGPRRPRTGDGASWRRVAGLYAAYRWHVCLAVLLVVGAVGLSALSPLLLQRVINQALPRHDTRLLVTLCAAIFVSGVLASGFLVALGALTNWIGENVVHELRADVYDRVQRMPLAFFGSEPNSEIQARLASDIGGISDVVTYTAQSMLTAATSLVAAGLVMVILNWQLAIASLVLAVALNILNLRFTRKRRILAAERQDGIAEMLKTVAEDLSLTGVILGRTFGRHDLQRARFMSVSREIRDLTYRQRVVGATARGLIGMTLSSLPPLVYLLSGTVVPGLSLGTVVVLSTMQMRVSGPIQQLLGLSGNLQTSLAQFGRVFAYLDMGPAEVLTEPDEPARPDAPVTLRARGICHHYGHDGGAALADVHVDLRPGSTTVVLGRTGAGKSTLALILSGLVAPSAGLIEINGSPAAMSRLRANVTLVSQEGAMFNSSIRDNLLFAAPDATDGRIAWAVREAGLQSVIAGLPDGLDTVVGERGYQLSGGERQRLALARALLVPSPILVADEATSAIDGPTADAVHASLLRNRGNSALVVIAHRIPRLRPEDHVLVLDRGRVAEYGTDRELRRNGPLYRGLLRAQDVLGPAGKAAENA